MDDIEVVERYAILLLSVDNKPIPSSLHLQKELFILTNSIKSVQRVFNYQPHYAGPFSQILKEIVDSPAYVENAFLLRNTQIFLSSNGQRASEQLKKEYDSSFKFNSIISSMKLVRSIYDRLSEDELLLLVYETYPEYTEYSSEYERVCKDKPLRRNLIESLSNKGVITEARKQELLHG